MPKWPEGFDQGRRDFLKTAGLALAGAVIGEAVLSTESSAETIEHTENIVASLKAESINNPIDFPDSFKIPEGKDAKLLGALMDFETRKAEVIDQCANEKLGSKKVEDIIKQIQSMRKIFWDQNPEIFGKYGEYSLENYYRTLLVDVPRHFAQYGIAIDPDVDIFKDFQFATYYYQEPKIFFYQIIKSEKTDLMVKGSSEKKKVYFINPLEFQSKKIGQNDRKAKVVAQMMFQNVFIHEDMIKPEIEDFLKRADEIAEQVNSNSSKTLDDKLSFISSQPDQLSAAVVVAQIETALRVAKKRVSEKDVLHDTTIHESVHIRDVKHNPKVGTERFRNAVDYYNKETNFGIYKEISAYLVQLRESSNRIYSFSHILNMFPAEVSNLSPYQSQGMGISFWVISNLVAETSQHPEKYGITVARSSAVSESNQIICQLDKLLDQPERFTKLLDDLIKIHEANPSEDFVRNMGLQIDRKPKTVGDFIKGNKKLEIGLGLSALAIVGLKRFFERRSIGLKEQAIGKALSERFKPREVERIIGDLQLREKKSDPARREKAVKLIRRNLPEELAERYLKGL